jgi:hypothetical protein
LPNVEYEDGFPRSLEPFTEKDKLFNPNHTRRKSLVADMKKGKVRNIS